MTDINCAIMQNYNLTVYMIIIMPIRRNSDNYYDNGLNFEALPIQC